MIRSLLQLIKVQFSKHRDFYWRMLGILSFLPGNLKLYEIAFIHKSASAKSKTGQIVNNERLEYLGDAILDAIMADYLDSRFPKKDEGLRRLWNAKRNRNLAQRGGVLFRSEHVSGVGVLELGDGDDVAGAG